MTATAEFFQWNELPLDNDEWLQDACPVEFRESENPWRRFAAHFFSHPTPTRDWLWLPSVNVEEAREKLRVLLWGKFNLPREVKYALAGWYLSLVLKEPPLMLRRWKVI